MKKNVDELLERKDHCTLSVPLNNLWIQHAIDEIYDTMQSPEHYRIIDDDVLYVHSWLYPWGGDPRRCYLHLYYNDEMKAHAIDRFNRKLIAYKEEVALGKPNAEHKEQYEAFFIVTTTKDIIEKYFDDLKNSLDMKRLRMHTIETVDGRLFVQFIALIITSALRREMQTSKLSEKYTVRKLLIEMDPLTKIRYAGKYGQILTEITKPQREILELLKTEAPGST